MNIKQLRTKLYMTKLDFVMFIISIILSVIEIILIVSLYNKK